MDLIKKLALFSIGGGGYVGLELLWRGRSHPSMFVLGGLCFNLLGWLRKTPGKLRPLFGAAICTAGELIFGLVLNRDHRIWDYRGVPMNFLGQICLPYSLLWGLLTVPAVALYGFLHSKIPPITHPVQDFS